MLYHVNIRNPELCTEKDQLEQKCDIRNTPKIRDRPML